MKYKLKITFGTWKNSNNYEHEIEALTVNEALKKYENYLKGKKVKPFRYSVSIEAKGEQSNDNILEI